LSLRAVGVEPDCCGAFGPLASLALGSPFAALRRPPSPLRGAVVEPACLTVGGSNQSGERWMPGEGFLTV
jgi:hypothetical protein